MNIKKEKINQREKYAQIREVEVNKFGGKIYLEVLNTLERLSGTNNYKGFIGIYWPIKTEVDLRELKNINKFSLALPFCKTNKEINFHPWLNDCFQKDLHGIPSPLCNTPLKPQQIDLLVVPALAIDLEGYRLGYGGGYFDRLRSKDYWKNIRAIVVLPEACISKKNLPRNHWDIPFDGWITEKGFQELR